MRNKMKNEMRAAIVAITIPLFYRMTKQNRFFVSNKYCYICIIKSIIESRIKSQESRVKINTGLTAEARRIFTIKNLSLYRPLCLNFLNSASPRLCGEELLHSIINYPLQIIN